MLAKRFEKEDSPDRSASSFDDTAIRPWVEIARLASVCGRQLRRLLGELCASETISDTEFLVLCFCAKQKHGVAQVELAQAIAVSPGQTSGLVERLRQRNLLAPTRNPNDRRRQLWRLTDDGRTLMQDMCRKMERLASQLNGEVTSEQRHSAMELLDLLVHLSRRVDASDSLPSQIADHSGELKKPFAQREAA